MTAEEWDTCTHPVRMFKAIGEFVNQRRLRLLAAQLYPSADVQAMETDDSKVQLLIKLMEQPATPVGRKRRHMISRLLQETLAQAPDETYLNPPGYFRLIDLRFFIQLALHMSNRSPVNQSSHICLLNCHLGNPFRPFQFLPTWLTYDVVTLARCIDHESAYDQLPRLHDALIDSGCDVPHFLSHCMCKNPHSPGCWVIDTILQHHQITSKSVASSSRGRQRNHPQRMRLGREFLRRRFSGD